MKNFEKHFADKLYNERRKKGLSQLEMAKKLSVSRSAIANIECGRQNINLSQFIKICIAIDVNPSKLLDDILKNGPCR